MSLSSGQGYYSEITRSDEILSLSQCLDQDKAVAQKNPDVESQREVKKFHVRFFFLARKKNQMSLTKVFLSNFFLNFDKFLSDATVAVFLRPKSSVTP